MRCVRGISFVVVTYNSMETIAECITSIFAQKMQPLELLVVDNASIDGTPDFVNSAFSGARVIKNRQNVGYGIANNTGARIARGDLIAIVNPDAALDPRWSSEIMNVIESNPKCAAAEGKLLLADQPGFINCAGSNINLLGFGCMSHYDEPSTAADADEKIVGYASGAAFAIRRDIFLELGGFDESYFLYHEDVELGLRVHETGREIRYAPKAIAYHHYKSYLGAAKLRYLERNRWKTLVKHMPTRYFLVCGPLLALSELGLIFRLASMGILGSKAGAILDFLRELPATIQARRRMRAVRRGRETPMDLLTDDFPRTLPRSGRSTLLGQQLVRAYYRAFIGRGRHRWS